MTQLSLLLNCDVDNPMEGNITYLEKTGKACLSLSEIDTEKIFPRQWSMANHWFTF